MSISPFKSRQTAGFPKAELIQIQGGLQSGSELLVIYRLARECGLRGEARCSQDRIEVVAVGAQRWLDRFVSLLQAEWPLPTEGSALVRQPLTGSWIFSDFTVVPMRLSYPDVGGLETASCAEYLRTVFDANTAPGLEVFASCRRCGLYRSSLAARLCLCCEAAAEPAAVSQDPAGDLRISLECREHALQPADSCLDSLRTACTLLRQGEIIGLEGADGFQLVCDATHELAVRQLRHQHQRHQPLPLMALDISTIEHYCHVLPEEKALLESLAAPIVLLESRSRLPGFWLETEFLSFCRGDFADQIPLAWAAESPAPLTPQTAGAPQIYPIAPSVAPGQHILVFRLAHTPLHYRLVQQLGRPIVILENSDTRSLPESNALQPELTSYMPRYVLRQQCLQTPLLQLAPSVLQLDRGQLQLLRRARGYALRPILLPAGFEHAPPLLAMGSDGQNTCLVSSGQAILSPLLTSLAVEQSAATGAPVLSWFEQVVQQPLALIAVPQPPLSAPPVGPRWAADLPIQPVQHHHAQVAACMAENGLPLQTSPVLGIVLGGLALGEDGHFWGCEFLLSTYCDYSRLATLQPVAGISPQLHQPWRSTTAYLNAAFSWAELVEICQDLALIAFLGDQACPEPRRLAADTLALERLPPPLTSAAGTLFEAVAVAVGLCRHSSVYEGQAAAELAALVAPEELPQTLPYPFEQIQRADGLWLLDPRPMWLSLLADLMQKTDAATISARFHVGLAAAIAALTRTLRHDHVFTQVALSGSLCQNRILTLEVTQRLEQLGLSVLTHSQVPSSRQGLSLGQAAIAAARCLQR